MTRPLMAALRRRPLAHPPVWIMRQAGRHLPEYKALRSKHSFQESVSTPDIAAELTLQPVRRYGMDGAVIFADIMTPLEAMGVAMTFDPGPRLRPHTLGEVAALADLDEQKVGFIAETIGKVRAAVPDHVSVIGFAGAPLTLLAYLVEGGGSKDFMGLRGALRADPLAADEALDTLARSMNRYLAMQIEGGADVVQLFDTWATMLDREAYARIAARPAEAALRNLDAPRIYFAPGANHTLDLQRDTKADAFGVDWRLPIVEAWDHLGDVALQGNLDPAILLTDPVTIRAAVGDVLGAVDRPGHILNLGHGIDHRTPPANVTAFVEAARQ